MMCVGIISGIISGILCAILIWIFQCLWNVGAKSTVLTCMSRLSTYFQAINNDINCGQEFPSAVLFSSLTEKASVALLHLDYAQNSIRSLNFRFHGRKHILAQMKEIEKNLVSILTIWELSSNNKDEWKSRFLELAHEQQTMYWNMACYRIETITELLKNRCPYGEKKALEIIDSIGLYESPDCEERHEDIRAKLKQIQI